MNKFIIMDGLPYLYADGKAYQCRWNAEGFTLGAEVALASAPAKTYSELSILAQCAGHLDSIGAEPKEQQAEQQAEPVKKPKSRKKKTAEE